MMPWRCEKERWAIAGIGPRKAVLKHTSLALSDSELCLYGTVSLSLVKSLILSCTLHVVAFAAGLLLFNPRIPTATP